MTTPSPSSTSPELVGVALRPHAPLRADYTPKWESEYFIVPILAARIEAALATYAAPLGRGPGEDPARAVDVGCGRQPFRARVEQMGFEYSSLDARQNAEGTVDFIGPVDQDLPRGLLARGPFQFVLCTEVMEHVADWAKAFANLAVLLAPGGRALVTCPHVYPLHEEPYDFWRPTPHALRYHAALAGLRVIEQQAVGDSWDVIGTAIGATQVHARGTGVSHRIIRKVVAGARKVVLRLLRSPRLRRLVELRGMYLANVVVLERTVNSRGELSPAVAEGGG